MGIEEIIIQQHCIYTTPPLQNSREMQGFTFSCVTRAVIANGKMVFQHDHFGMYNIFQSLGGGGESWK